ncbi:S8 family serine peptidase [Gloeocapsopsis dulcis]|uniref:Peptidase S8 and S53 subtilisin kexin sedolisin n=1 Tax=Gloeocapsopsis dulcis AAB1 = 1H9 TaxID=1433147 RepID=A0A6N8FPW9_9CHRO|nr:S8 family serine peptidase [Gloeocapsopsis dulcis]MUL34924.1 peptidase S8 and S53 subtilisin kexin sedolisin [Gloeocapsopsis dulcis AAB1 = 1H9]WNN90004.1 S8 family serine peptidase [Gloeocapsopsis dulcis]
MLATSRRNNEYFSVTSTHESLEKVRSTSRVLESGILPEFDDPLSNSRTSYSSSVSNSVTPQVAPDPGSTLSTAYNLGTLNRPFTLTDFVGNNDVSDIYRFSLASNSSFNLSLNGLTADADVELLNGNGTRIRLSNASGTTSEWIDGSLNAGTYYLNVFRYTGNTNYRLSLSATPIVNGVRTVLGNLGADTFIWQSGFNRTVISGNGNVDFGSGALDTLNLTNISSTTARLNLANASGGGVVYNPGNGARVFDAITLNNGNQILFEGIDRIRFADRTINRFVRPNDPLFNQQWNLHMMGVHNAWNFTKGSTNVMIGVQDTGLGVNSNGNIHPELRTTLIFNNNYRDEFIGGDNYTSHGTAVQGIIAARSNNGIGMSGINWNSPVFNIDVLGGNQADYNLAQATQAMINQANSQGQKLIVNMSLGGGGRDFAFERLIANNQSKALFVIASGNSNTNSISYPANLASVYSNVIAVGASWGTRNANNGATTPGDRISYAGWWGSQYGTGLTLVGPSEVIAPYANRNGQFGYWGGSTSGFNGTSAATPNVAGVASLVWSANRNLSATRIKQIFSQTAFDLGARGYDTTYGHGFVNADAAVRRAMAIGRGVA